MYKLDKAYSNGPLNDEQKKRAKELGLDYIK
jgi:hypothetical protein